MMKSQNMGMGDGEITRKTKSATSTVHQSMEAKNLSVCDRMPTHSQPADATHRKSK